MLPRDLKPENFAGYPPEARKLMIAHLDVLRQLPLSFVPSLLREAIDYDYRFPAERSALDRELATLNVLSPAKLRDRFEPFAQTLAVPGSGGIRLDQSAGAVRGTAIGIHVEHAPTRCLPQGRDRLWSRVAGRYAAGAAACSPARHCRHRPGCLYPMTANCSAICARTAHISAG